MSNDSCCKICGNSIKPLFQAKVLMKYPVKYFCCSTCSFIQTEKVFWLNEAYDSAITKLDIGLVYRNIQLANKLEKIIYEDLLIPKGIFLDYGGGYGMFVRMMRDKGFNFYRQDKYCTNLFAESFDLEDAPTKKFDFITAFEVFEHLDNPLKEIEKMFQLTDTIIFSTELQPNNKPLNSPDDWWYFVPEVGQHIALFHAKTLQQLAKQFNCHLSTNNYNLHILSKKYSGINLEDKKNITSRLKKIWQIIFPAKKTYIRNDSLLQSDFNFIKEKMGN